MIVLSRLTVFLSPLLSFSHLFLAEICSFACLAFPYSEGEGGGGSRSTLDYRSAGPAIDPALGA